MPPPRSAPRGARVLSSRGASSVWSSALAPRSMACQSLISSDAMAASALRRDEEHARVGDAARGSGRRARPPRTCAWPLSLSVAHAASHRAITRGAQRAASVRDIGLHLDLDLALAATLAGQGEALAVEAREDLGVELAHLVEELGAGGHDVGGAGVQLDAPEVGHAPAAALASTMCSRACSAYSAAARKASLRHAIGVVPAWSAWPMKMTRCAGCPRCPRRRRSGCPPPRGAGPARCAARRRRTAPCGSRAPWAPAGVEAGARHRVDEPLAVDGRHVGDRRGVERAAERPRAEEAAVAALLVAPRRDDEGQPRGAARFADRLQALEAGEHAEGAVERAALRHRVDVRAGDHGRAAPLPSRPKVLPAGSTHVLEAGRLHPREQPGARFLVRRAPARAGDAARREFAEARERLDVGAQPRQGDGE